MIKPAISGLWLTFLVPILGCSGPSEPGDDQEPSPTASISGVVYRTDTGAPVSGATVSAGVPQVTTGNDGAYRLTGLDPGLVRLRASADRFEPWEGDIQLSEGENDRDIMLDAQTVFNAGAFTISMPTSVETVKGVFLYLAGQGFDTRPIASGEFPPGTPGEIIDLWREMLEILTPHGVVVLGALLEERTPLMQDSVFSILDTFADMTGHQELSGAALIPVGYSWGGCFVAMLAARHPERIIGFQLLRGACAPPVNNMTGLVEVLRDVPAQFIIGEADNAVAGANQDVIDVFEANRPTGALWALAVEPNAGHDITEPSRELWLNWLDPVLALRLPAFSTGGMIALETIDESKGWLGDRQTRVVADYASYTGDRSQAVWLPSEQTALNWRDFGISQTAFPRLKAVRGRAR